MSPARRKRHSKIEIAAKIVQADDLAAQGVLTQEIARLLGVSLMTLHRWRKARPGPASPEEVARFEAELGPDRSVAELKLENARLRQLLVDLLLEKVMLEEGGSPPGRRPR
jgi:putative transposase